MLYKNVTFDDESHHFETPTKHNQISTATSAHIMLGNNTLHYQHNTTTNMTRQKLPLSGMDYLCLQMDGKTYHAVQCDKSRALTKVIEEVISNESFEHQCVILKRVFQS